MVPTAIAIEKPTYVVERGGVASQLFKSGRVAPVTQAQVSFAADGFIASLPVSRGEEVQAGDVVAVMDTAALEQALQAAALDLRLAQEQVAIAQESKAKDRRRAEIGVELVQLRLDFAVAEAGTSPTGEQVLAVEVLKRELELAELNLTELDGEVDPTLSSRAAQMAREVERIEGLIAQATLVAPIAGTITAVNAAAGDPIIAGEPVLVIGDLTTVEVQLPLLEREVQALAEGMAAVGTLPSRPGASFPMTVRQLPYPYGTGGQNDAATDTIAHLAFADPAQVAGVSIGERIEVAVLLESHSDVLWLPPAAIREFNGRLFVVVQEGEAQKRLDIKIGLQNDNQIEIVSGVAEGQLVVGP